MPITGNALAQNIGNAYDAFVNESIDRFIREFHGGSQTAAADSLGVRQPTVSEWLREVRPVPHASCADIERLSDGLIEATKVRADDRWFRIPDPGWKWHPAGRPALNVTKVVA
jgi:DNA-binding transcriptional regulator YdaS (Cro superfamily)